MPGCMEELYRLSSLGKMTSPSPEIVQVLCLLAQSLAWSKPSTNVCGKNEENGPQFKSWKCTLNFGFLFSEMRMITPELV